MENAGNSSNKVLETLEAGNVSSQPSPSVSNRNDSQTDNNADRSDITNPTYTKIAERGKDGVSYQQYEDMLNNNSDNNNPIRTPNIKIPYTSERGYY